MNLSIITGQIISQPKLIRWNKANIISMVISIPNDKKKLSFCKIQVYGKISMGQQFYDLYKKKDFIIITGLLYIKKRKKIHTSLVMKFSDIQLCMYNLK